MAHYIYLPVPSAEMLALANTLIQTCSGTTQLRVLRNEYAQGWHKGFNRLIGKGCLQGVTANDTVYVFLHGTGYANSEFIGANRGHVQQGPNTWGGGAANQLKKYDITHIAAAIEGEGLPKNFRNLHLLTCGSGLAGNKAAADAKAFTNTPLAERLRLELVRRGYPTIEVTGYLGDVIVSAKRNDWFAIEIKDGEFTPAADASAHKVFHR